MFDNLGMGEFLVLAFFALLFFGPERLPQMAAKLGEWLGKLTYQSKLFMNQWREEALVIHDAVEEVRGIRDEIMAAQRQLTDTMNSARGDIDESLSEVKETVGGSRASIESLAAAAKEEERQRALQSLDQKARGEEEAIEQTQAILARAQAQLTDDPLADGAGIPQEPFQTQTPAAIEATAQAELDPRAQIEQATAAWRETLAAPARPQETPAPVEAQPPVAEQRVKSGVLPGAFVAQSVHDPNANRSHGLSAAERSAQIMERMRRQMAGEPVDDLESLLTPPPAPEAEGQPAAPDQQEDEWTRNRNLIHEALRGKPKEAPVVVPGADNGTQLKIGELDGQVASLQNEIQVLKKALESLRAEMLLKTALLAGADKD